jgi:hyaluronoglucosaminidase
MLRGGVLVALALAFAVVPVMAKKPTPQLRGVVEGYYGRPWSGAARRDVIRFMGDHGLDTFVYGPKNDPYHRDHWRDPYPADALADFRETATTAKKAKVRFVVAVSPGLDVCYACKDDFAALTAKLRALAKARVRYFALFFDDVFGGLTRPEDLARYGGSDQESLARAHADLTNRTDRWLRRRGLPGLVFMVPSDYAGIECHPYHGALARALRPRIPIGWTGTGVFAITLGGAQARAFGDCVGGHPVVLWDNFPVNDTVLSSNLHLGPLTGRDADLTRALRGHLLNPMTQAHASLVAIGTAAAYFDDPAGYDPEAAWQATLSELDPSGGLAILAAQTRSSPLDLDDARALGAAVDLVAASHATPDWTTAVAALEAELDPQRAAPATIAANLGGTPLGDEIAPWVDELAAHVASATDGARLLRALKPSVADLTASTTAGQIRVTGRALPPDGATIAALAGFATVPALPSIGDLVTCKGNLLSADIKLCPELGLNVHGKALYPVPYSLEDFQIITGRNVYRKLLELIAARYADYQNRQGPGANALTVTLEGAAATVAPDGTFDVIATLPASGSAVLSISTAAGDATNVRVP